MDQSKTALGFSLAITKIKDRELAEKQLLMWFPRLQSQELNELLKEADLPITSASEVETQYEKLFKKTSAIRACGLDTVRGQFPVGPGEMVQGQYYTVLEEAYKGIAKGTVVLCRSLTSMDTAIFMNFGSVRANELTLREYEEENAEVEIPSPPFTAIASAIASKIVLTIIGAVVGKVTGKLMDKLMDEIMPPSPPTYLTEVYETMKIIVREQLDDHTLDLTHGSLSQLMKSLKIDYYNEKTDKRLSSPEGRQILFDLLNGFNQTISNDIRAKLEIDRYKVSGIEIWRNAVSFHYVIYMEMAQLDRFADRMRDSSYITTLKDHLKDDIQYLQAAHDSIEIMRNSLFESGSYFVADVLNNFFGDEFYFRDNYADYQREFRKSGCKDDPAARRDQKMAWYKHNDFDLPIIRDLAPLKEQIHEMKTLLNTLENQ